MLGKAGIVRKQEERARVSKERMSESMLPILSEGCSVSDILRDFLLYFVFVCRLFLASSIIPG